MRLWVLSVFVIALLPFSSAAKWGYAGHAISAAVAQTMLNTLAQDKVAQLIPEVGGSMADIASWADTVKSKYPWSSAAHYADQYNDWQCVYNPSLDCPDGICVDTAIQNYTKRLHDVGLPFDQRNEALKFLVHYIGDVHQPLHAGFLSDLGGNQLTGTFMGSRTNLHSLWDTGLLQKRIDDDFGSEEPRFIDYLISEIRGPWASEAKRWAECTSRPYSACSPDWMQETSKAACDHSYVDADGVTHLQTGYALADAYYHRNIPVVELQLAKAAVRMATVLNHIFSS